MLPGSSRVKATTLVPPLVMTPGNVTVAVEVGVRVSVSVPLPAALSVTVPPEVPDNDPIPSELPLRSRTAVLLLMETADELPRAVVLPAWRVPPLIVVAPL